MKKTHDIQKLVLGMFETNCYILTTEKKNAVLIDPADNAVLILDYLNKNNLSLKKILLTHGHRDHIDACAEIAIATGADVYINPNDFGMISDYRKSIPAGFRPKNFRPVTDYIPVQDGDNIIIDEVVFEALYTPGHTMGGSCYIAGDAIFTGDTLFYGTIGNTGFQTGDVELMEKSLERLKRLDYNYRVFPGHGESTTLDYEKRNNPYLQDDMRIY